MIKIPDIYFWRQMAIVTSTLMMGVSVGIMTAYPSTLTGAIMAMGSDKASAKDHVSWINAGKGIAGIVGAFTMTAIFQQLGRKSVHLAMNVLILLGWILFCFSNSITTMYVARFFHGFPIGGIYYNSIILAEYVHPTRRGYSVSLKKTTIGVGILCCHTMMPFWTWRQIPIFAAGCTVLSFLLNLFWPKSPYFLAVKGKEAECGKTFHWLHGDSTESRKQLRNLIDSKIRIQQEDNQSKTSTMRRIFKVFLKRDFLKSFFIVTILTLAADLCGKHFFAIYIIEIMTQLLGDNVSVFYFTIGADLMGVVSLFLSSIVTRYFNRRALLYSTGAAAVLSMMLISLLTYLDSLYTFSTGLRWMTAIIIISEYFIVNLGVIPVAFTLVGELFPLESKAIGGCLSGIIFSFSLAVSMKLTPVLMKHAGLTGAYGIYGVCLGVCLISIYKVLPETKDETLGDIEKTLRGEPKSDHVEVDPLISGYLSS